MANRLSRTCRRLELGLELGEPQEGTACPGVGSAEAPPRLDAPSLSLERQGEAPGDRSGMGGNEVWKAGRPGLDAERPLSAVPRHSAFFHRSAEPPPNGFGEGSDGGLFWTASAGSNAEKGLHGRLSEAGGQARDAAAGTKAVDCGRRCTFTSRGCSGADGDRTE